MISLFGVPVDAAYHVVTALSALLTPIAGGLAVAAAIVVFTVAVRLLVLPFSYYAIAARPRRPGSRRRSRPSGSATPSSPNVFRAS